MLTKPQMLARSKRVTRRLGWWALKADDLVRGVEKGMGLKKGEKVVQVAVIRILDVRGEPLSRLLEEPTYGQAECALEGFPSLTPLEFVEMFCQSHRGCKPDTVVNRIYFDFVEP